MTLNYQVLILNILFTDYFKTPYKHPDQYYGPIIFPDRNIQLFGATSEKAPLSS